MSAIIDQPLDVPARQLRRPQSRIHLAAQHAIVWGALILCYFLFPSYLALATNVAIMMLFALALDLAVGYAGIATLGHAAFFGTGAYAAGLVALHLAPEPIAGLLLGGVAAGLLGLATGPVVLRTHGLASITITLAVAALLHEVASAASGITGGHNGLTGYVMAPVLGLFEFDLWGRTAYLYALCVLAIVFVICHFLVQSPFGLTVIGTRENPVRMRLLGVPVKRRLLAMYAISAAFAGLAGALSAQVTGLVSTDSLEFMLSGDVLIMLIIGGLARLYGALVGAAILVIFSDRIAALSPTHWLFTLGILLILVVRFAPDGLLGLGERISARLSRRRGGA